MLSATEKEVPPLTRELDTLTLWITAAAGLTMIVMFALGRQRDQAWDALFVSAVSLAIAAIPEALPTVTQAILSVAASTWRSGTPSSRNCRRWRPWRSRRRSTRTRPAP